MCVQRSQCPQAKFSDWTPSSFFVENTKPGRKPIFRDYFRPRLCGSPRRKSLALRSQSAIIPHATGLLPEVLHTDLLSRIITARSTAVFRLSRCSSPPKYIKHVCTFSLNIFCVCFYTNHKNNGRKKRTLRQLISKNRGPAPS